MKGIDIPISGDGAPHTGTKKADVQGPELKRINSELQSLCLKGLTDLLQRFFVVVDDELFKRSDKFDSNSHQSLYFHEMRQFRVESAALQNNFLEQIRSDYDAFWSQAPQSESNGPASPNAFPSAKNPEFSLLENEALEEEIAVSTMIQKGNKLFQESLTGLSKRLASLIRREELDFGEIPFSPDAVCRAFSGAIRPVALDIVVKLLIYKLFDRVVVTSLGSFYLEINNFLIAERVLPNLPKAPKRGATAQPSGMMAPGSLGAPTDVSDVGQMAYVEVFQGMQRLLDGWRAQMGMVPLAGEGNGIHAPPLDPGEVINALSMMQIPQGLESGGFIGGRDGLKLQVAGQLAEAHPGEKRSLGRQEEDIIDMVALIFDFILDDRNLPDAVKGLIARLQIPVIKVAIIEKSFFGRKNHPVRLLLNSLAQAGIGLDAGEDILESPVYKKIESTVMRILDEFDQNVGLFSDLLDEFIVFLEKENQRSRVAEERTRQVTQSREQLHLAKRKIAYEIATRLEGKATPSAVRSFLYNTWKDVLVLSYLRRDKQPRDWENALLVMDKLIWTVTPAVDAHERKAIIQMIPRLLKAIRVGLESVSMDPQSVAASIKELEYCHVSRLSSQSHDVPIPGGTGTVQAVDDDPGRAVEIRDPELAEAIKEIKANLPEVQNLTAKDLSVAAAANSEVARSDVVTPDAMGEQGDRNRAIALELGSWVEFDDNHKQVRGKLSWKSQVSSNYVFVNRKGAKIIEVSLEDLANRLSEGSARLIEDADIPLMDRAIGALLNKLNSPMAKSA